MKAQLKMYEEQAETGNVTTKKCKSVRQGEVSHIHHGAVKVLCENAPPRVRQKLATSNLVYSQRKARAAGAVEVWLTGAQSAHVTKTSQAGFHSFRHISMQ